MATPTQSNQSKVIGVGIDFPIGFAQSRNDQLLNLSGDIPEIHQSIQLILDTRRGERYNNPEFGSDVPSLVFEPNDTILKDLLYYSVVTAIQRWEKRITVTQVKFLDPSMNTDVSVDQQEHVIRIIITYIINSSQTVGSYVYPFVRNAMPMSNVVQGRESFNLASYSTKG